MDGISCVAEPCAQALENMPQNASPGSAQSPGRFVSFPFRSQEKWKVHPFVLTVANSMTGCATELCEQHMYAEAE
jgi:hypothetical protein